MPACADLLGAEDQKAIKTDVIPESKKHNLEEKEQIKNKNAIKK